MSTSPQSPPRRRPRLSLQIKAIANGSSGRTSRSVAAHVNVKSPTSFNTLSNAYATAVDRSTPIQEHAPTSILGGGGPQAGAGRRPSLRLQTQPPPQNPVMAAKTRTPYLGPLLDTPLTAQPMSPAVAMARDVCFPSAMTATPPLSAQPPDNNGAQVFTFDLKSPFLSTNNSSKTPITAVPHQKRRTTLPAGTLKLPYHHPRSLRSILRNSPLPPLSTATPDSPRRQSLRLQEKAARRVAYNSPLEQTITTSKYIKSHVDLLINDDCETPISPSSTSSTLSDDSSNILDTTMSYSNTRDGGHTPGPFEEMRRRMANMSNTPLSPGGIRKKQQQRKEKKRRWVWTIGQDDEEGNGEALPGTPGGFVCVAAPLPKNLETQTVPVIAVPAPRPRRAQAAVQLPSTMVPQQREITPVPLVSSVPSLQSSPEYRSQSFSSSTGSIIEPVTPSLESNHSLLFDSSSAVLSRDVEMSDSSSMMSSEDEDGYQHVELGIGDEKIHMDFAGAGGQDTDMDGITPTIGGAWREFLGYGNNNNKKQQQQQQQHGIMG
ncbi:putative glucan 1, 4-alpha-glucosidase [Podospora fimiseda]|uniref:Glucan 1, 4-alpha-glucosidase n=1 Tax=Podospora fimiseda TaxID=252190 RepID=A0AAN7BS18_9PEZI|nr:putative glucan 1, 4-alpha-glucosidase [Podospora fimiseda]